MKIAKQMFGALAADMRRTSELERQALVDEAEARLDAPVTRREVLDAIRDVRDHFGGSGFPEQEAIYNAFDRLLDALS